MFSQKRLVPNINYDHDLNDDNLFCVNQRLICENLREINRNLCLSSLAVKEEYIKLRMKSEE